MYVKYGDYTHPSDLTGFSKDVRTVLNPITGLPVSQIHTVRIRGELRGDTQADLRTAIQGLEGAYAVNGKPWGLYHDDDTVSAHYLGTVGLVRPITVVRGPSYPASDGAEYATKRTYEIELEAEYTTGGSVVTLLVAWQESVSIFGTGGPIKVVTPTMFGTPIQHQLTNYSVVRAIQQGSAVGRSEWPVSEVPGPIWPQWELVDRRENATSNPESSSAALIDWPLSWKYEFESPVPLFGTAHYPLLPVGP